MLCLQFFGGRKLAFVFRKSPSSLNEFIGYVELTDFCEIWPELALMTKKQKYVGEFSYFKYFSRGGLWRITFWKLFDAGTWQFHKKITNENTGKCWHTLWLTRTVILHQQSHLIPNKFDGRSISHFGVYRLLSPYERSSQREHCFSRILHFLAFLLIYSLCGFSWKQREYEFLFWRTPAKVCSNRSL